MKKGHPPIISIMSHGFLKTNTNNKDLSWEFIIIHPYLCMFRVRYSLRKTSLPLTVQASEIDSMGINRPGWSHRKLAKWRKVQPRTSTSPCKVGGRGSGFSSKWMFPKWGVFPPKSSIWIGVFHLQTIYFGVPLFLETGLWGLYKMAKTISV